VTVDGDVSAGDTVESCSIGHSGRAWSDSVGAAVAAAGVRFAALGVLGFLFSVLFCSLDYRSDVRGEYEVVVKSRSPIYAPCVRYDALVMKLLLCI